MDDDHEQAVRSSSPAWTHLRGCQEAARDSKHQVRVSRGSSSHPSGESSVSKNSQLLKLLTPELKAKVEKATKEYLAIAKKEFKRDFDMPEIRYDIKNHDGGRAYSSFNRIRYNLILLVENEEHFLKQTVGHEVAHIINRQVSKVPEGKKRLMPHGKEWKDIMKRVFDLPPKVTHSYDCSSIERHSKRKFKNSKARVDSALNVIRSVLKRANKKFTPEELGRFNHELES